jgi:hypothetical protein
VNGLPWVTGVSTGEGEGENSAEGEGDGEGDASAMSWPVACRAVAAAGMKYAKPPATAATALASTARKMMRIGLMRPRDARARRPGLIPSGKGKHFNAARDLCL